ncbi:winged helix-turn-helix domain-containing protein [Brochothrix campestris]|uniref:Replication-associated protein n=1 Tax=Brochothrix campestris FSL F6-1037 TaxID=1265861 RepID=W7CRM8_9LIST|nr:winged helix-turn-helix domain-containing protein [Brochothrix campestris]EUJ35648.1 replication-associated protein [Brochothrix campestris FSL F6-1037]
MSEKTIKELAEELNVSKQTVQYHIKFLPTNYTTKNDKNIIMINAKGQAYIKGKVRKKTDKKTNKQIDKETPNYTTKENEYLYLELVK